MLALESNLVSSYSLEIDYVQIFREISAKRFQICRRNCDERREKNSFSFNFFSKTTQRPFKIITYPVKSLKKVLLMTAIEGLMQKNDCHGRPILYFIRL